jgi:hypothetical protein
VCVTTLSSSKRYPSGSSKRKRAKHAEVLVKSRREDIFKFFKANIGASINPNNELAIVAVEEKEPGDENFESDQQTEF